MKIQFVTRSNYKPMTTDVHGSRTFKTFEKIKDVKVIDKEKDLFEIYDKVVETSSIDLDKYTQSFKGQTGLEAVMKRVAITGDSSLLNTISYDKEQPVFDATNIPTSLDEVKALANQVKDIYNKLPQELKKGNNPENILQLTQAQLDSYIKAEVDKALAATVNKEVKSNE